MRVVWTITLDGDDEFAIEPGELAELDRALEDFIAGEVITQGGTWSLEATHKVDL